MANTEQIPYHFPTEIDRIRAGLPYYHGKWGFLIYRCTHDDQDAWRQLIETIHAKSRAECDFHREEDLMESVDMMVVEDLALEGAGKDEVRRRCQELAPSLTLAHGASYERPHESGPDIYNGRDEVCLYVDKTCLETFKDDPEQAWIVEIDLQFELPTRETFDWEGIGKDPEIEDPADQGEDEVEGCEMEDVGWMYVRVRDVGPWLLDGLGNSGWINYYVRPPKVMDEW